MRKKTVLLLAILQLSVCYAGAAEKYPYIQIKPFPIFVWCAPEPTPQHMQWFKEGNFTVMAIAPKEQVYEQLKKNWEGNFIVTQTWAEDRSASMDTMLNFHKEDSKKIGCLVSDEPNSPEFPKLKQIFDHFRKEDPNRLCFVNLFPAEAGEFRLGESYQDHLEHYFEYLNPRFCSFDHYPCMRFNHDMPTYYNNIEQMRRLALKNISQMIGFIQAVSTNENRDVSESDLAWQVNTMLAYGCKGLWYFRYTTAPYKSRKIEAGARDVSVYPIEVREYATTVYDVGEGILDGNDRPSYMYPFIKKINAETLVWGETLANLRSTHVRHSGNSGYVAPVGAEMLRGDSIDTVQNVVASNPQKDMGFIVGYFENSNKQQYVMIVNKRHGEFLSRKECSVDAVVTFRPDIKKAFSISNIDGKELPVTISNGQAILSIEGGSAVLLRLESSGK